jgi:hypothetical protein
MFMSEKIVEILKYVLPALIVLIASYSIISRFLKKEIERKQLDIYEKNATTSMQMRLQAYERLCIFVERMHPNSMISRYYTQQATAQDVQLAMVQGIRAEWEHNVSQQLYVSHETWETIKAVAEQEITMINTIGASLPLGAPSSEFINRIAQMIVKAENTSPTTLALEQLNKEAKVLLFGS